MLIFQNLAVSELRALQEKLERIILGVTYDAWATTHHSRFVVPAEFANLPGVPSIIGDTRTQYCNEPAILVEHILGYRRDRTESTCGTHPRVLHHYLTHRNRSDDPEPFLHGLAEKLGCRVKPAGVDLFAKVVMLERTHLALYPDINSTLPEIASHYRLSLASNLCQLSANDMMNVPVVEHLDSSQSPACVRPFGSYFSSRVFSFEEGQTKPDLFSAVERRSEIPLSRQIIIGDNPDTDVLGALRAGYGFAFLLDRTMNLKRFAHLNLPDNVIYGTSMTQFLALLPCGKAL